MSDKNESMSYWKIPVFVLVGLGMLYALYIMFGAKLAFDSVDTRKASAEFISACIGVKEGLGKPKECLNFYNEVAPKILSSGQKGDFLGSVREDNFRDLYRGLQEFLDKAKGNSAFADWPRLKTLDEIYGNQKPQ